MSCFNRINKTKFLKDELCWRKKGISVDSKERDINYQIGTNNKPFKIISNMFQMENNEGKQTSSIIVETYKK